MLRRPRRPNGQNVAPSIDQVATAGWVCAIAARTTSAALVLFWSLRAGLVALGADLVLSSAVNARLHHVIRHRDGTGELDQSAPTIWDRYWSRRYVKAIVKWDAKADKYLARASATEDDFTAWNLRRKADRKRLWVARARGLIVD